MKFCLLYLLLISVIAQKDEKMNEKKDTDFENEVDYGNPDIYGLIERPCPVYDRFCIRGFFAKHSYCRIAPGPVEDPYYVTQLQIYLSSVNTTITSNDCNFSGLNGLIQDFYINKATGNLVLSVFFESFGFISRQAYYRFFRNGKEPVLRSDGDVINYRTLTVTIVIPNYKNLRLDNAEITGYLDVPITPLVIGPKVSGSLDPTARAAIQGIIDDLPSAVKASLLIISTLVGKIFVQKSICDFGIAVSKIGY